MLHEALRRRPYMFVWKNMLMSHSRHSNHVRNAYVNTEYEPRGGGYFPILADGGYGPRGRVLPYIGRRGIWAPGEGTFLYCQTGMCRR